MNSYQKLKKENQLLNYTVKKLEAEMEFLSQNIDLRLNRQVANILVTYLLRSNLKKQIEEIVWRGKVGGVSGENDNLNKNYVVKSDGIIKFNKLDNA